MLVIGLLELGLAFRDFLTVSTASTDGARVASLMGNDADADCEVVMAVTAAITTAISIETVDRIDIFKADPNGNKIPSKTNTWQYLAGDPLDCGNWSNTNNWPPGERQTLAGSEALDIAGVQVVAEHAWFSGMAPFSGTIDVDETTLTRLEPEGYE